jgi:hypothetical protein
MVLLFVKVLKLCMFVVKFIYAVNIVHDVSCLHIDLVSCVCNLSLYCFYLASR